MPQNLTIFFSDIANSTRLYQDNGDAIAHQLITDCLDKLRATVEAHNGKLLRTVGDAVLASFAKSDNALEAAVDSQRMQLKSPLSIRIGFHAGEVIPHEGDVYGNAVNLAARVASFANAEEIYTTEDTVKQLSPSMKELAFYLDKVEFKGIQQAMPIYRIRWLEDSTSKLSADTQIVTAVNRPEVGGSDQKLKLTIGAVTVDVDEQNPLVRIGRDESNDIVVQHESTSRQHVVIEYRNNQYSLIDSSTNGTYLVRTGDSALFVRRDKISLGHSGIIGAGWHPSLNDDQGIVYQLVPVAVRERNAGSSMATS